MKDLAYECKCHISPPCYYCEKMCGDCDGSGEAIEPKPFKGIVDKDLSDRVFLGEIEEDQAITYQKRRNAECETCQGEGYIDD
jgi:DnaJ-class molecular chaperone